jgi:Methyltransferase domain
MPPVKSFLKRALPRPMWTLLSGIKQCILHPRKLWSVCFNARNMERLGVKMARKNDFYSPLPSILQLDKHKTRWYKPSSLVGVDYDVAKMEELADRLIREHSDEYFRTLSHDELVREGYGYGLTPLDALLLYCMLREYRPQRFLEVGSGVSSYIAHAAGMRNAESGPIMDIVSVDPYAFPKLHSVPGIRIVSQEIQDYPLHEFEALKSGDVLFIDSTHVVRIDGDVSYLVLEVLPRLANGVIVHIHDVPFPYNVPYPADGNMFQAPWPVYWTEAMLVQAFLAFNTSYKILLSTPLIRYHDDTFLAQRIPNYHELKPMWSGVAPSSEIHCSLWIMKAGADSQPSRRAPGSSQGTK